MNSQDKSKVTVSNKEFEAIGELKQNTGNTFNRVTVVESIYHETNDGPTQIPTPSFSYELVSDEQAYMRIMNIGKEVQKVDTGWLKDNVSILHILNLEGKIPSVRMTEEQREEVSQKVIQVLVGQEALSDKKSIIIPFAYITPRKSIRLICNNFNGLPNLSQHYWIRSLSGDCKIQITCLPV